MLKSRQLVLYCISSDTKWMTLGRHWVTNGYATGWLISEFHFSKHLTRVLTFPIVHLIPPPVSMPIPIAPLLFMSFCNFLSRTWGTLGACGKHLPGYDAACYYSLSAASCLRCKLLDTPAHCTGRGRGCCGLAAQTQVEATPAAATERECERGRGRELISTLMKRIM